MTIYRDQLEAVYALIEKPESWCQKAYSMDAKKQALGSPVSDSDDDAKHPDACSWCLAGAAIKCGVIRRDTHDGGALSFAGLLDIGDHSGAIAEFNDSHTHPEVLAILKSAIERAPTREQQP